MKTILTLASAALALTLTACDSKPTVTNLPAAAQEVAPQTAPAESPKAREVPPATKPVMQSPASKPASETPKAEVKAALPPPVEVKKTAAIEKSETEAGLASTVDHARTVTKSQDSKARTRAQKAEDEMKEMEEMMRAQKQ